MSRGGGYEAYLTPEQRKENARRSRQAYLEKLQADPAAWAAYKEKQRLAQEAYRKKKAAEDPEQWRKKEALRKQEAYRRGGAEARAQVTRRTRERRARARGEDSQREQRELMERREQGEVWLRPPGTVRMKQPRQQVKSVPAARQKQPRPGLYRVVKDGVVIGLSRSEASAVRLAEAVGGVVLGG